MTTADTARGIADAAAAQTLAGVLAPAPPCGSRAAYIRHVRASETPCAECREANRRYMADYRDRNPEVREKNVAALRARDRAIRRLIDAHRAEFLALFDDEAAREVSA